MYNRRLGPPDQNRTDTQNVSRSPYQRLGPSQNSMPPSPQTDNNLSVFATANIEVNITRAIFMAVPGEHPAHYRPLTITFTDAEKSRLAAATENGLVINSLALRDVARDIVQPSQQSQGKLRIDNGWDVQRFAFFLEAEIKTANTTSYQVVTGYTSELGLSERLGRNSQCWDPTMRLYINSCMTLRESIGRYQDGDFKVMDVNQILRPVSVEYGGATSCGTAVTGIRPTDTMRALQLHVRGCNRDKVVDTTNTILGQGAMGMASSRNNEVSSKYLENILKSYSLAYNNNVDSSISDQSWLLGNAVSACRETNLDSNLFFKYLGERTSYKVAGFIEMGELLSTWPHLSNPSFNTVIMPERGSITDYRPFSSNMGGSDGLSRAAHALTHTVPTALSQCVLSMATFTANNLNMSGTIDVATIYLSPIFDVSQEKERYIKNQFESLLTGSILPEIFTPGDDFDLTMTCSLFGISEIEISVNGSPMEPFRGPNYADGLTSSVVAQDDGVLEDMAIKIGGVLETTFNGSNDPGAPTSMLYY